MAERQRWSVFLDLDNTILDFTKAERIALTQTLIERGVTVTEAVLLRYRDINIYCWEQLEDGKMARDEVLRRRFEMLFEELGLSCDGQEATERYEGLLHFGHWFIPGAEELLKTLAPVHDLYLASNGVASVQHSRIASAGIAPYFKGIFISEEIGAVKPQKAFFEACFARIPDFDPARALMVGDSLTSDIRGGINAGIRTCWYNPKNLPVPEGYNIDYIITDLHEIYGILG